MTATQPMVLTRKNLSFQQGNLEEVIAQATDLAGAAVAINSGWTSRFFIKQNPSTALLNPKAKIEAVALTLCVPTLGADGSAKFEFNGNLPGYIDTVNNTYSIHLSHDAFATYAVIQSGNLTIVADPASQL